MKRIFRAVLVAALLVGVRFAVASLRKRARRSIKHSRRNMKGSRRRMKRSLRRLRK
jgi:hypothetical protein